MSRGPALVAALLLAASGTRAAAPEGEPAGSKALDLLVGRLSDRILAAHPEVPVAVGVSSASPALGNATAALLGSRLSAGGLPSFVLSGEEEPASRAQAQGAATLVHLVVRLDGELTAAGELRTVRRNFWSGRTPVGDGPALALAASVPADAGARVLWAAGQGPVGLVLHPNPLARFGERTAAVAAGDIDGDGHGEVAVLLESEVQLIDEGGRLLARFSLAGLPPAPIPVREPFGTLCIRDGLLEVVPANAAGGVTLRLTGSSLTPTGVAPRPTLGCGGDSLPARFVAGVARLQTEGPPANRPVWGGDVRRGHRALLFPDGTATWVRPGESEAQQIPGVGAGGALVDWADEMFLAATSDAANPAEDRLRVVGERSSLGDVAVPGRVLQVCRAVLDGRVVLVLGVWTPGGGSELRIVWRRP
ncbi:MAG TPA: hypothetical protein VFN91_03160 [Myxococcaceae bacterium]|nr:hypothetical protein [Myxococcaceae bacterium]